MARALSLLWLLSALASAAEAPPSLAALLAQAYAEFAQGRFETAAEGYRAALAFSPTSVDARLGLLFTLLELGELDQAEVLSDGLLKDDSENAAALKASAYLAYLAGRFEEAEGRYRAALAAEPNNPVLELGLGLSLVRRGAPTEGALYCEAAGERLEGDPRVADCLRLAARRVWVRPWLYAFTGGFVGNSPKREYSGGILAVELLAVGGLGAELELGFTWYHLPGLNADFQEFSPGGAIFHLGESHLFWAHYTALLGEKGDPGSGHALSLYAGFEFGRSGLSLGTGCHFGMYAGFETVQIDLELGWRLSRAWSIYLLPMLQLRHGDLRRPEVAEPFSPAVRGSAELGLSFATRLVSLTLAGYGGRRWFTAENRGLLIGNSDEDWLWGLRLRTVIFPEAGLSPEFGLRIDWADHQSGLAREVLAIAATAGVRARF